MNNDSFIQSILMHIRHLYLIIKLQYIHSLEIGWYRIWNAGLLLWWYRLWIRKDEFHRSLDMDLLAMLAMNKKQKERYVEDLTRRRSIAHERDMDDEMS